MTPAVRPDPTLHANGLKAGSLLEQSLASLTEEQARTLLFKAADARLSIEIEAARADRQLISGVRMAEAHIAAARRLGGGGSLRGDAIRSSIEMGAGHMGIESRSGFACFVATAAYGAADHPDVIFLRRFRDEHLSTTGTGRRFINWYYRRGPALAHYVASRPILRAISRGTIGVIVLALRGVECCYTETPRLPHS